MKIEQINEAAKSPEVLLELSRKQSFFTGWALSSGAGASLAIAVSMGAGMTGGFALIPAFIGVAYSMIQGIWGGLIATLFARGRQRDLYKKLSRRTEKLLKYIKEKDDELENAVTDEEAEQIKKEGQRYIRRELENLEDIQTELETHIEDDTGSSGPLRSSFRQKLNRKLSGGAELKDAFKQIRREVEDFDVDVSQDAGQINTQ